MCVARNDVFSFGGPESRLDISIATVDPFLMSSTSLATIEMVPILILQLSLNYMECKTRTFIRCAGFVEMAIASGVGFT